MKDGYESAEKSILPKRKGWTDREEPWMLHTVSPVTWGLLDWLTGGRKIYPKSGSHFLGATDFKDHEAALCSWLDCLHSAAAIETSLTGDRLYFLGTLTRPESS